LAPNRLSAPIRAGFLPSGMETGAKATEVPMIMKEM
jgi:hypothetical protein